MRFTLKWAIFIYLFSQLARNLINLLINQSANQLTNQPTHQIIHPSIHLCVYPSIHPFLHPSVYLCMHSSTHPSIHLGIHPSIHPFKLHYTLKFRVPSFGFSSWMVWWLADDESDQMNTNTTVFTSDDAEMFSLGIWLVIAGFFQNYETFQKHTHTCLLTQASKLNQSSLRYRFMLRGL